MDRNRLMKIPLSDLDIKRALPNTLVKKYSELSAYRTIHDLLPNKGDSMIIILEDRRNSGHWVAMMNLGRYFYYFNSYGGKYDTDLNIIPRAIRACLGETHQEIRRLLGKEYCEYNKKKYQGENSEVCGRYCIVAIEMMCHMGFDPSEFLTFMNKQKNESELSYDQVVCRLCPI